MEYNNFNIKVVLHDYDGTHIKTEKVYANNYKKESDFANYVFGEDFGKKVIEKCKERKKILFDVAGVTNGTHVNTFGYTLYKEALVFGMSENEAKDVSTRASEIALEVFDPQVQKDAGSHERSKEFLYFLESRGIRNYLVTLGTEWSQFNRIKNLEYQEWFNKDNVYTVNHDKYSQIEDICDRFDFDKNTVAFIGDSWGGDIVPALKAGILPIHVRRYDKLILHGDEDNGDERVIRVNSLGEIMDDFGYLFGSKQD